MLRLTLSQYEWARYDFGRNTTFRLYEEDGTTAFDATGYTGVVKAFKRHGDRAFFFRDVERALTVVGNLAQIINDITVSWTTQASGIGTFAWTQSDRPSVPGFLWIEVQLTKTGEQTSSELIRTFVHSSEAA